MEQSLIDLLHRCTVKLTVGRGYGTGFFVAPGLILTCAHVVKEAGTHPIHSVLKFFQVDNAGMLRMTSSARYFKEGVGSSRPSWRWIMCFLERPKAKTSFRALVKCCRQLLGASEDTKSSMTSTRHSTCTCALRLPTVYAGRLFLSWASWAGCTNSA